MVQAQCPTATIANIDDSGSGGCWCQYGYNPTPDSSGYMSCVLMTAAPTFTRAPTPAGYRDLDGDGVQDVAPEGSCCISQYGVGFTTNNDACGNTLAEVAASGCCPSPFVARYHLGFGGESTDSYDCVSFISKEDCNSYGQTWSGGAMRISVVRMCAPFPAFLQTNVPVPLSAHSPSPPAGVH